MYSNHAVVKQTTSRKWFSLEYGRTAERESDRCSYQYKCRPFADALARTVNFTNYFLIINLDILLS